MTSEFKGKKIIVVVPNHFGLPEVFRKNLEFLGLEVFLLEQGDFNTKLSIQRAAIHFLKKNLKKNKTYKAKWISKQKEHSQLEFLKNVQETDFALVIRPDLLSESVLSQITEKANFSIAYQWDGMSRFPLAQNTIKFFDRFFVFDQEDVKNFPGTIHTDNFYFDYLAEECSIKKETFFVGTFMKNRMRELVNLSRVFQDLGMKTNINIIYAKERHRKNFHGTAIHFTKTSMSFEENMKNAKVSSIILDFQNSIHNGLSFRAFEAIGFGKKLITNNALVKNYDFFNKQNVFVVDNNLEEISAFINEDQIDLSKETIVKYSFSSWIQKVFQQ